MKKVKIISILLVVLLLTCVFCGFMGCETEYEKNLKRVKETEYFRYINYEGRELYGYKNYIGKDEAHILELTELGKQQEVLVIPEEIDGMKVIAIGGEIYGGSLGPRPTYFLKSENLKKIYVKAKNIYTGSRYGNCTQVLKSIIINDDLNDSINMLNWFTSDKDIYFFNIPETLKQYQNIPQNFLEANIIFFVDDKLWWLDISEDEIYLPPDIPSKLNQNFVGWYTEPEFINKWNGEYKIPEGQEKLNLYAKFE